MKNSKSKAKRLAHALHRRARILTYESHVTGPVEIFNHDPH